MTPQNMVNGIFREHVLEQTVVLVHYGTSASLENHDYEHPVGSRKMHGQMLVGSCKTTGKRSGT